jgi:hypothetical protein
MGRGTVDRVVAMYHHEGLPPIRAMTHSDTASAASDDLPFADTVIMASHDGDDEPSLPELPHSLCAILDPSDALAAAQRMQRWYQSSPQGPAQSLFGRDGRRVEGRLTVEYAEGGDY